jgi:UDP-N-acetylmuramoylalanine-D-glutamate ligase
MSETKHVAEMEVQLRAIVAAGDALKGPAGRMQELCEDAQTVCFDNDSDSESAERYAAAIAAWDVATKEAR